MRRATRPGTTQGTCGGRSRRIASTSSSLRAPSRASSVEACATFKEVRGAPYSLRMRHVGEGVPDRCSGTGFLVDEGDVR